MLRNCLETISGGCFAGDELEEITIPSNVRRIENNAFCSCKNLKKITFTGQKIEKCAFANYGL